MIEMSFPHIENFRILRKICKKLCFTLYEAVDIMSEKRIFLKVLDEKFSADGIYIYDFLNGARLSSLLKSKQICKVYDYGKVNDHYIIVSEPIDAKPLSLFVHEEFPIPLKKVVDVVSEIANVLRFAHLRGIVHGLLNPCSIFVADDGSIKIDDFCFHWIVPHLCNLDGTEALYLSYYVSPECYQGTVNIDGRSDIYSLGIILLQILTDDLPFYGEAPVSKNMNLPISTSSLCDLSLNYPERLEKIITKSLNKNSENRFWNMKDFIEELKLLKSESMTYSKASNKKA
jgi:serine/threonine-protein kinase